MLFVCLEVVLVCESFGGIWLDKILCFVGCCYCCVDDCGCFFGCVIVVKIGGLELGLDYVVDDYKFGMFVYD